MEEPGSFRDTLYTVGKDGKRQWVYSNVVKGKFFNYRLIVAIFLMAIYLLLPWVTIGGRQGVLIDIPGRQFTFFGSTFWATETVYLAFIFAIAGLSLFFFTSLFGRVWCGWACPETIFLEFVFRPIERLIEGDAASRKRLDKSPWTFEKIRKKFLKHSICALISWVIASTFLAYFIGREPLLEMMSGSPLNNPGPFLMTLVVMALFAFQFGWFREQFCTVLCPYARFQSVLMDDQSLVVGYDYQRGEPRGKLKDDQTGDCIDCKLCVRVCPTGIDIRNGLQLECVSCTQCIDACDSIMEKVGKPKGLIRYDTESSLKGGQTKILRPRVFIYGTLLFFLTCVLSYLLLNRTLSSFQVLRVPEPSPYSLVASNIYSNHFQVMVENKSREVQKYSFEVEGAEKVIVPRSPYPVNAESREGIPIFIQFNKDDLKNGKKKVSIIIKSDQGFVDKQTVTLLGPG